MNRLVVFIGVENPPNAKAHLALIHSHKRIYRYILKLTPMGRAKRNPTI